jgi:hypothetical protein
LDGAYPYCSAGPTGTPRTTSTDFRIGSDAGNGGSDHQFLGILDAWGIANGNPLDSDIATLYNSGSGWELSSYVSRIYQSGQSVKRASSW